MSSSGAMESYTPISGGCGDGGGTTSSVTDNPMKDEAVDSNPFQEGEHVLAYHGLCLYDAKVSCCCWLLLFHLLFLLTIITIFVVFIVFPFLYWKTQIDLCKCKVFLFTADSDIPFWSFNHYPDSYKKYTRIVLVDDISCSVISWIVWCIHCWSEAYFIVS